MSSIRRIFQDTIITILYKNYNIILHDVKKRCILPPGWGALPKRNYISYFSYKLRLNSLIIKKLEAGSWRRFAPGVSVESPVKVTHKTTLLSFPVPNSQFPIPSAPPHLRALCGRKKSSATLRPPREAYFIYTIFRICTWRSYRALTI